MLSSKRSIYTVSKRGKNYYFIRKRKPIPKSYFAYKYLKELSEHSRRRAFKRLKYIRRNSPGIYGIFIKEKGQNKLNIGKCLYIGQSVKIKTRKNQHLECIKQAKRDIKQDKPYYLRHLDYKYYKLAQDEIKGKTLLFVCIKDFEKKEWDKYDLNQIRELLCLWEQWAIDTFKPKYNTIASRMTDISCFR